MNEAKRNECSFERLVMRLMDEAGLCAYGEDTGSYDVPAPAMLSRIGRIVEASMQLGRDECIAAQDQGEVQRLRDALETIAAYPYSRDQEMGATAMRKVARDALAATKGESNESCPIRTGQEAVQTYCFGCSKKRPCKAIGTYKYEGEAYNIYVCQWCRAETTKRKKRGLPC